nr:MAG TPA: hypothetical protein [Caudoviricetes sp.]
MFPVSFFLFPGFPVSSWWQACPRTCHGRDRWLTMPPKSPKKGTKRYYTPTGW